jgi:hypothetical protein
LKAKQPARLLYHLFFIGSLTMVSLQREKKCLGNANYCVWPLKAA